MTDLAHPPLSDMFLEVCGRRQNFFQHFFQQEAKFGFLKNECTCLVSHLSAGDAPTSISWLGESGQVHMFRLSNSISHSWRHPCLKFRPWWMLDNDFKFVFLRIGPKWAGLNVLSDRKEPPVACVGPPNHSAHNGPNGLIFPPIGSEIMFLAESILSFSLAWAGSLSNEPMIADLM